MNTPTTDPTFESSRPELQLPTGDHKDYVQKELDQLQAIISRMAGNSFQCKGWAIGIVTIALAINKDSFLLSGWQSMLLLLPVFVFWYLDGFFLYTEQRYRDLFNDVVRKRFYTHSAQAQSDWSNLFDYNYTRFEHDRVRNKGFWTHHLIIFLTNRVVRFGHWLIGSKKSPAKINTIASAMFSKTLMPFYLLPTLFVVFATLKGMGFIQLPEVKQAKESVTVQLDSATLAPVFQMLEQGRKDLPVVEPDSTKK